MKTLKLVWLTFIQLVRQRQTVLDKREAERLDRIRNPSKYRVR